MDDTAAPNPSDARQQAIDEGVARLRELHVRGPAKTVATVVLKLLKQRDPEELLSSVEALQRDIRAVDDVLSHVLERGLTAQRAEAEAQPFGTAWLSELRRTLGREDLQARPREWVAVWLGAWSDALAVSRWDCCDDIAEIQHQELDLQGLRTDMTKVSHHLRADQSSFGALPAAKAILSRPDVPPRAAVRLNVLCSRGARRFSNDPTEAVALAEDARRRSANADWSTKSLALAALAEAHLNNDRLTDAHDVLDGALEGQAATVDLLAAAGQLAAKEGTFSRANDFFDVAAYSFGREAVESHLLREVSGNLLWRTARRIRLNDRDGGVTLLDQALSAGIVGASERPERRALLERAELLEELGRVSEAAACYKEAGDAYLESGSKNAVSVYERARDLSPHVAAYNWAYGEALRRSVDDRYPGRADELLLRARDAFDKGFSEEPDERSAWALVSAALVSAGLRDGRDAILMVERGLLLDQNYPRAVAFLIMLLRDQGYPRDAVEDVHVSMEVGTGDPLLTSYGAFALSDMGRYQDAIDLIDNHLAHWPGTPEMTLQWAVLQLRLAVDENPLSPDRSRVEVAIDSLEGEQADGRFAFVRGVCLGVLWELEEARRCFDAVRADESVDRKLVAWAEYRVGHLDAAIQVYDELIEQATAASRDPLIGLDLGQVLLVRGDPEQGDISRGRETIDDAIAEVNQVDDLVHMVTLEFPLARRAVAGMPHEDLVSEALDALERRVGERCIELQTRTRPSSEPSQLLGRGRRALAAGRFEEALGVYADVMRSGGPHEVANGIEAAADGLVDEGDRLLSEGDVPAARRSWLGLEPVLDLVPEDSDGLLESRVNARLALSSLELNGPEDPETIRFLERSDASAVSEALRLFARDFPTAWAHYDAMREVAEAHTGLAELAEVASGLPLEQVYALNRDAPGASGQPLVEGAIGLAIGDTHAHLISTEEMQGSIPALREELAADIGVRIPGVRVYAEGTLPPDSVRFLVYGERAADVSVSGAAPDPLALIVSSFRDTLLDNMFRFVSNDDVDLWAEGWEFTSPEGPDDVDDVWLPPDPLQRFRLARLLRMLLREGIPVRARSAILRSFRETGEQKRVGPLDALAAVRRVVYPATLGPDPDARLWPVPDPLQDRLAAGLVGDGSDAWELPRADVLDLVRDLRRWRESELPTGVVAVIVRDERVRLALWRLLAADRPRVYVLATGDLP